MAKKTLSEKTIDQICTKLADFLADTFILYVKTLNYHWNMQGPNFFMYHKLLESQYEQMAHANDEIAERIRMLGRSAPATLASFLKLTSLKEGKTGLSEEQMIHDLAESHEIMVESCHKLISFTENAEDQGTADLIIEQIRFHAKQAWLLRSHLVKS
jgi:starvation-inducible DNA-binding protein